MAARADETCEIAVGNRALARETGLSRPRVAEELAALGLAGLLSIKKTVRKRTSTTRYRLNISYEELQRAFFDSADIAEADREHEIWRTTEDGRAILQLVANLRRGNGS
jgi:hypothetical protein